MSAAGTTQVLRRPIVTEKSTHAIERFNVYVFEVDRGSNKLQIKKAVEEQFGVKVTKVNTRWRRGKTKRLGRTLGRTSPQKQAIVTVAQGDKIDVY